MGNGYVFDGDASVFAEVPKMMTSECSSESMDDIFEELDCLLCSGRNKRLVFNPHGELVNGDVYIPKTAWRRLERPNHVQSPAYKRPSSRPSQLLGLLHAGDWT